MNHFFFNYYVRINSIQAKSKLEQNDNPPSLKQALFYM